VTGHRAAPARSPASTRCSPSPSPVAPARSAFAWRSGASNRAVMTAIFRRPPDPGGGGRGRRERFSSAYS
jgi:hypothetical protein